MHEPNPGNLLSWTNRWRRTPVVDVPPPGYLPADFRLRRPCPIILRLRRSPLLAGLLDGVNVVSLALMAGVTWQLGRPAIVTPIPALLALTALVLLFVTAINPTWLILVSGAMGLASQAILG